MLLSDRTERWVPELGTDYQGTVSLDNDAIVMAVLDQISLLRPRMQLKK